MKNVFNTALFLAAINLVGCAGVSTRQDEIDSAVGAQVDVLKKIVELRKQEPVRTKINSDPVLAEQENVLMSGLGSVINSQETYLKARAEEKSDELRGVHVR